MIPAVVGLVRRGHWDGMVVREFVFVCASPLERSSRVAKKGEFAGTIGLVRSAVVAGSSDPARTFGLEGTAITSGDWRRSILWPVSCTSPPFSRR